MSHDSRFTAGGGCPGHQHPAYSRRDFLRRSSLGFGSLAFSGLAHESSAAETATHFAPRAKRVIFLFMEGGVSQVDSYDPKPELTKRSGQPAEWEPDQLSQLLSVDRYWFGSPWRFQQHGASGLWVSDLFPHAARVIDDLCVVRSLIGETPLHASAFTLCTRLQPRERTVGRGNWHR